MHYQVSTELRTAGRPMMSKVWVLLQPGDRTFLALVVFSVTISAIVRSVPTYIIAHQQQAKCFDEKNHKRTSRVNKTILQPNHTATNRATVN